MKVTVYSREEIERIIKSGDFPENTAVITFYDTAVKRVDENYTHVHYEDVCRDVFYCELDDLDIGYLGEKGLTYEMYFDYADDLAEFIYDVYGLGMDIICQCDYGQSRSAGCAAAILQHFYKTGIDVFIDYRRYPNQLVYHKVFDALEKYKNQSGN